jgi:VanZ family protein
MPIKNILKHKYFILAVAYTVWLTVLSLTPLNNVPLPEIQFGDKVVHFFLYFFLIIVWLLACQKLWQYKYYFITVIILWGIIIEFLQEYFIAFRTGDIYDALANGVGAIIGFIGYKYFLKK